MKQFLLIGFLLLAQIELIAQKYFQIDTIGTSWNELKELGSEKPFYEKWIESYYVSGDTLIKSNKYFKVYKNTGIEAHYIGCFREKNKIVSYIGVDYFGFDTDTAIVLYDFNKGINDEVLTGVWHKDKIINIDSILVSEKYRKRYILSSGEKWIEGIGSTYGFFYPMTNIPTTYWRSELACFKKDEIVIYLNPNFSDCTTQILQGINELKTELFFKIYPNPANRTNEIIIESEKISIDRIQVFSLSGQLLKTYNCKKAHEVKIITSDYSSNIYILRVYDSFGKVYTNKLIIE
jgi:hypothetical protein